MSTLVQQPRNEGPFHWLLGAVLVIAATIFPMTTQQPEVTRATLAYYAQARTLTLTATDFYQWLASLPDKRRGEVLKHGFSTRQHPDFLRYCLERRSCRLPDFMAEQLSLPDFAQWVASGSSNPFSPF